jgi:hypothetical protein
MKISKLISTLIAVAACITTVAIPIATRAAEPGSDQAFNEMISTMAGRDTGSERFDYYVAVLNQEIALHDATQPFGAAGPNGPLDGFSGYIAGFQMPDSGSTWFNNYVDAVNVVIKEKQAADELMDK